MNVSNIRDVARIVLPGLVVLAYVVAVFVDPAAAETLKEFATPALALYLVADGGARIAQRNQKTG